MTEDAAEAAREKVAQIIREDLGICGCGQPELVLTFVHEALRLIKKRSDDWTDKNNAELLKHFRLDEKYKGDDLFYYMAWYFIDRSGLIEHGGGVGGSWLTDKGKEFLAYLDAHPPSEIFADDWGSPA